jgi:multiple sugar transport system permease protein
MGMVSKVGRRSWTTRLLLASISALLGAGALTMLYPFGQMLAGSTQSSADLREKRLVPAFLTSRDALWRKHAEGLFNESVVLLRCTYGNDVSSFDRLPPPITPNQPFAHEFLEFLREQDFGPSYYTVGYLEANSTKRVLPLALREFRNELSRKFGRIDELNRAMGTEFTDWGDVRLILPYYFRRTQTIGKVPMNLALEEFMQRQPLARRVYFSIDGFYRDQFLRPQYPDIESYNAQHGSAYATYTQVRLKRTASQCANPAEQASWETFVRSILSPLWIRLTPASATAYRQYLKAKYAAIATLNSNYHSTYSDFTGIAPALEPPTGGLPLADWIEFIRGWRDPQSATTYAAPLEAMRIDCIDFLFQDHLARRFDTIDQLNRAMNTRFADFTQISMPQQDVHVLDFEARVPQVQWEFVRRNYITVLDYIAFHGRAIWNTIVYCALAIAAALLVNPLAAYALSRYHPPSTYSLLLLLMLTMAFPPMVTQIPVFLMLRDFGLLNTYWALILPGLANGYSIFLLKGFFDSLPRELYESATIDGASEVRIFWQITMSLSKPILAVTALSAFTAAYSNFMFALLICQEERMWTLMVWLYQLQSRAGQGVVLASVTMAALPTLVVFVLCQRVIMQGIVVPVEK